MHRRIPAGQTDKVNKKTFNGAKGQTIRLGGRGGGTVKKNMHKDNVRKKNHASTYQAKKNLARQCGRLIYLFYSNLKIAQRRWSQSVDYLKL